MEEVTAPGRNETTVSQVLLTLIIVFSYSEMGDFGQVGGLVTVSAWTYEYITVIHITIQKQ